MLPSLKAAFALLSLLELISSSPLTTISPKVKLSEITHRIQQLNSGVQVNAATPPGVSLLADQRDITDDVLWCFGHPSPFQPTLWVLSAWLGGTRGCLGQAG